MKVSNCLLFWSVSVLLSLTIYGCEGGDSKTKTNKRNKAEENNHGKRDAATLEKFEFIRKEPGNELGIFTKVIAQSHRKANQTTDEFSINLEYISKDFLESVLDRCKSSQNERPFEWRNCVSTKEGLFALVTGGVPEPKNKTVTYLELTFKPFDKAGENGETRFCVLDEVYKSKAYIVLNTYSHLPSNDTFPRDFVESVDTVHQHQLDTFGEHFLSIFGDKIDRKEIYNFGKDEYYDRDPPYECFLSIGSSESKSVIEKKCDFFCPEIKKVPPGTVEKILNEAKEKADKDEEDEEAEEEEEVVEDNHDEL